MSQTRKNGAALRVGLLLDDLVVSKYIRDLIRWADERNDIELCCLVLPEQPPNRGAEDAGMTARLVRLLSQLLHKLVLAVEALVINRTEYHRDHFRRYRIGKDLVGVDLIALPAADSGSATAGSRSDIDSIRARKLDLLVHCGSNPAGERLSALSRLGTILFRYPDNGGTRPAPPGFWAAYRGHHSSECTIELLAPEGNSRRVLMCGRFPTRLAFSLNQAGLYAKAHAHLRRILDGFDETALPGSVASWTPAASRCAMPEWRDSAGYLLRTVGRISKKLILRSLQFRQQWRISLAKGDWRHADLANSLEIVPPRGHFWADPFLYKYNNKTYCLVEDYSYKAQMGGIAALELNDTGVVSCRHALFESYHLSFPFLFEFEGNLYMCPESARLKQIRVYRCVNFPERWQLARVLMSGVAAADTLIFSRNGKWWMLTNIDAAEIDEHSAELYLFHADSPLSTQWTPHVQNPIRIDCQGGRNGGLITRDGRLFRIGQRHGFDQYGLGFFVYEIIRIDETAYAEKLVWEVDADFKRGLLGTHHLSNVEGTVAIDHVSWAKAF